METITLASQSETRRKLLTSAGVEFTTLPAAIDEEEIRSSLESEGADPAAIAETLAEHKARVISRKRPGDLVIGADQILECEKTIFSKPVDFDTAKDQLTKLRGKDHQLCSSVVVFHNSERVWHNTDTAHLRMRNFSDDFLNTYIEKLGEKLLYGPGCYQVEGLGIQLFSRITGDHFTILGLPLLPLLDYLRLRGAISE
ncbi:MAG: septum formation protein Maf [Rhodospirillaceae bacterium]|nr:septum formation protein Maf [Rhodospirillaceae bacterium]|tara:strand:- start:14632 stop:15228 length:597 start_codon:yes stop_codon:yes gene_type:complete